jgi:hypothetical protein
MSPRAFMGGGSVDGGRAAAGVASKPEGGGAA